MKKNLNKFIEYFKNPTFRLGLIVLFCLFIWGTSLIIRKSQIGFKNLQLRNLNNNIAEIQNIIGQSKSVEEGRGFLKNNFDILNSKLPAKEDAALQKVSDVAKDLDLKIISIQSQSKQAWLDEKNQKVLLEGKECQILTVSIVLQGKYKQFYDFIYQLPSILPVVFKINHIMMQRNAVQPALLDISLELKLYLLV